MKTVLHLSHESGVQGQVIMAAHGVRTNLRQSLGARSIPLPELLNLSDEAAQGFDAVDLGLLKKYNKFTSR